MCLFSATKVQNSFEMKKYSVKKLLVVPYFFEANDAFARQV
jgi:hypothetical protein